MRELLISAHSRFGRVNTEDALGSWTAVSRHRSHYFRLLAASLNRRSHGARSGVGDQPVRGWDGRLQNQPQLARLGFRTDRVLLPGARLRRFRTPPPRDSRWLLLHIQLHTGLSV